MEGGTRRCSKCRKYKLVSARNVESQICNCRACCEASSAAMREKREKNGTNKENLSDETEDEKLDLSEFIGASAMDLDAFLDALTDAGDINLFSALVDVSGIEKEDVKETADAIAELVWEKIGYRFHYHSVYNFKNSATARYEYHCAQSSTRQHKSKKGLEGKKQRDKGQMRTFDCQGWLTIWGCSGRRFGCHEKYVCIDVPEDVKQFIEENSKLRSYQLWKEILKKHPLPAFSQKAVYNPVWRRSDNELDSAKILLAEFAHNPTYQIESIPLPADGGVNTTKAGYECFALLGEVFGSGLPTSSPDPNQKEKYIRSFIRNLLDKWNLDVIQSLSDKDMTEINALLAELPDDIKHQVCFWHSIRIVRGRLSVLARRPAFYDVNEAFREFDWIDRDFLPIGQLDPELQTPDRLQVAQSTIPTIKLRFQGQLAERSCPCSSQTTSVHRLSGNPDSDANLERLEDVSEDLSAEDRIDGPKSWFETWGDCFLLRAQPTSSALLFIVPQLLRIFIRHFCEHPLLRTAREIFRSAKQIRDAAVFEMYKFCEQRGLREVWAYMWTAWYCPSKYKLMARASQPDFIGRWRTTMSVENFWRNLKHGTLHHLLHPRLDQLVYLIATEVPPFIRSQNAEFRSRLPQRALKSSHPHSKTIQEGVENS
ncbi:SWIM-type domain-containing protein [Favolaschia claudopus]|uniref:SWIM-type domain-containing protein n=1 Tax=Favolaschia claudopus TaxID=2862362 RepID=A0AAV9Z168_9AGAR